MYHPPSIWWTYTEISWKKTPVRVFFDFQIATHITSAMAQMHANVNIATRHGQPNSLTSLLIEGHESVMVDVQTQEGGGGGCETSKKHVKISQIDQWPFQNFTKLNWRCLPYLFHYIYIHIHTYRYKVCFVGLNFSGISFRIYSVESRLLAQLRLLRGFLQGGSQQLLARILWELWEMSQGYNGLYWDIISNNMTMGFF